MCKDEGTSFSSIPTNFSEFIQLYVTDPMVCVPLDSTQHAWDQGCSQNCFVLSHRVDQFHGFDLRAKLSLGGFVAECHWDNFRIADCRQPASQKSMLGLQRQVESKSRP